MHKLAKANLPWPSVILKDCQAIQSPSALLVKQGCRLIYAFKAIACPERIGITKRRPMVFLRSAVGKLHADLNEDWGTVLKSNLSGLQSGIVHSLCITAIDPYAWDAI